MTTNINFNNHVKSLNNSMRGMNRILYLGTEYDISKYPALADKTWSCIYTPSRNVTLADLFTKENRQVRPICTKVEYERETTKLDHGNPMLIFFNGVISSNEEINDIDLQSDLEEEREFLLETLSDFLKSNLMVELVIVGYNPTNTSEISPDELYKTVRKLSDKRVEIFGLSEKAASNKYIKALEDRGLAYLFSQDLGEAFEKLTVSEYEDEESDAIIPSNTEELNRTVYINGEARMLSSNLCQAFNRFGRILSVREMTTPPINRMLKAEYFYKFLKTSPNSPQWYGYTKQNGFAVKRGFEDQLYNLVEKAMEGDRATPIILAGQSGSGKSIALAALAYRVFHEHKYPVLFINNPDVQISLNSDPERALDNILLEIRNLGGRALVILDWSIYNVLRTDSVRKISNIYNNRGHNVLFVASAMRGDNLRKGYNVIETPAKLSEEELRAFKILMVEKAKLPRNRVENYMEKFRDDNSLLLSMLYKLIYELHPQLERGIKKEISMALDDTKEEIDSLEAPIIKGQPMTELAAKLIEAGYFVTQKEQTEEEAQKTKQEIIDSLQDFSEGVAVSTLYKLRMPMTLAIKLLKIPECNNSDEYRKAVFDAPWIVSALDDDPYSPGEYYVSFRDPMDARIYLNSLNYNEADQMRIVANVIAAVGENKGSYYGEEVRFLERLIRMVGPNSDDDIVKDNWIFKYGKGCQAVIDQLKGLREKGIIEPILVAQEVTYIREYYVQSNNDNNLNETIFWLEQAIKIAEEVLEKADREEETQYWKQGVIDSIAVERINAEVRLDSYRQKANESGIAIEDPEEFPKQSYEMQYGILKNVIIRQPDNSYPYTALLSCFMSKYAGNSKQFSTEEMLTNMSDILAIVDSVEASIPSVEDNDYYIKSKQDFYRFFDSKVINSNRAEKYFDELLNKGSAVGVHMKARAILRNAGVNCNEEVTSAKAKTACAEALAILENPSYEKVVRSHAPSQFLRLQLSWLIRNKKPVFVQERQVTYMCKEDWTHIYQICSSIRENIFERDTSSQYKATVYYIMALASAQLGDYREALRILNNVLESEIFTSNRQRTWHTLSKENGEPMKFTGTFNRKNLPDRQIYIKEMSELAVYQNLQSINMSRESGEAPDLCIGMSYRGFQAFADRKVHSVRR